MSNPNPQNQFKKGNKLSKGRPKRDWTVQSLIEKAMEEEDETGVPAKKIVYDKLVALAKRGDLMAIKELNNRLDGMPKQNLKFSGDEDNPIKVDITSTLNKVYGKQS